MTHMAACYKVSLLLSVCIDVILLIRKLRMILEMIDVMDEACPRILALLFAVLAFIVLVMHNLL